MHGPSQSTSPESSESPRGASGWSQTFASLRYPNYRLLWFSTLFVSGGNWIQQVTLGWLAYDLTGSNIQLAIVLGLRALPMLFSPVAGVLADRFDRRRMFMLNHAWLAVLAVLFATVLLLDIIQLWHLYLFSFLAGVGWSLNNPLRQTLVGSSVPREDLMNAIALHSMAFNSMRMIGPALGGGLIFLLGAGTNFLVQAVMYVGVFLVLIPFKVKYGTPRAASTQSPFRDLVEGLRYIRGNHITLVVILLSFVPTLFVMSFIMTQMPAYVADVIGDDGGWQLGLLMASMGLGGLMGTTLIARFSRIRHKGRMILISVTAATIGMLAVSQATTMWVAVPILVVQQAFFMVVMTTNNTVLQTITPDHMRGRVMGVYMVDVGMQPLGGVLAGVIATFYGVPLAWVVGATIGLVFTICVAILAPAFRRLEV
ncbi:MAG: MFS transporter [Dehalococcoidia bacterium]